MTNLDYGRLACAWQMKEDYARSAISQPWDDPDEQATNSVAAGWACLLGRAILVEEQSGTHSAFLYDDDAQARAAWPAFEETYGEPEGEK